MLGAAGDPSVIPQLRHFLRDGQHVTIKAQAAKRLAWLADVSSVYEIKRALEASTAELGLTSNPTLRRAAIRSLVASVKPIFPEEPNPAGTDSITFWFARLTLPPRCD